MPGKKQVKLKAMSDDQVKTELQKLGVVDHEFSFGAPNLQRWIQIITTLIDLFKKFKEEDPVMQNAGDDEELVNQHECCNRTVDACLESLKSALELKALCHPDSE